MSDDQVNEAKKRIKEELGRLSTMGEAEIKEKYLDIEKTEEFHTISKMINPKFKCAVDGCEVCLKNGNS